MARWSAVLFCLAGFAAADAARTLDETISCKAGLYNCGCKLGSHQWTPNNPRAPLFESEELCKKGSACWGDLAQFNCPKGKKAEVLAEAFAEAKRTNKLLLYFGNTGG